MCVGETSREIDTKFLLKESKLPSMQENLDKELWETNKCLEQNEVMRFPVERVKSS
jgi:hypothetical protein